MINLIGLNRKAWDGSLKDIISKTDELTDEEAEWIVEAVQQRLNRQKIGW